MEFEDARQKFIQSWGSLGSQWGINRTMAQIHALLLVAPEPLSAEDIMEELMISRGNTNMNVRTLIDWGLVYKEFKTGERKEFFRGEKDIWLVTKRVIAIRRQRELEPMMKVLASLNDVTTEPGNKEHKAFTESIKGVKKFAGQADKVLEMVARSEEKWFWNIMLKMIR